jgi:hypothetical protein
VDPVCFPDLVLVLQRLHLKVPRVQPEARNLLREMHQQLVDVGGGSGVVALHEETAPLDACLPDEHRLGLPADVLVVDEVEDDLVLLKDSGGVEKLLVRRRIWPSRDAPGGGRFP